VRRSGVAPLRPGRRVPSPGLDPDATSATPVCLTLSAMPAWPRQTDHRRARTVCFRLYVTPACWSEREPSSTSSRDPEAGTPTPADDGSEHEPQAKHRRMKPGWSRFFTRARTRGHDDFSAVGIGPGTRWSVAPPGPWARFSTDSSTGRPRNSWVCADAPKGPLWALLGPSGECQSDSKLRSSCCSVRRAASLQQSRTA